MKIKEIEKELDEINDFMSADENQGFLFSMSQAQDRAEYLEKLLKKLQVPAKIK